MYDYVIRILLQIGECSTFHILINNIILMIELLFPVKVIFLQMNFTLCLQILDFIYLQDSSKRKVRHWYFINGKVYILNVSKDSKLLCIRRQIAVIFIRVIHFHVDIIIFPSKASRFVFILGKDKLPNQAIYYANKAAADQSEKEYSKSYQNISLRMLQEQDTWSLAMFDSDTEAQRFTESRYF